jgi:hypothetical protein
MYRTMIAGVTVAALLVAVFCVAAPAAEKVSAAKATSTLVLPAVKVDPPENKHFITKWLTLGNFTFGENDFGGDPQKDSLDKAFMANEAALDGTQAAPKGTKWEEKSFNDPSSDGKIDLGEEPEHATVYAVAWVNAPEKITDAKLLVGSDDYMKVWINGKQVFAYNTERRSGEADQDTVPGITLEKGPNRVVVKCVNIVFAWCFYLRFADKAGNAYVVK